MKSMSEVGGCTPWRNPPDTWVPRPRQRLKKPERKYLCGACPHNINQHSCYRNICLVSGCDCTEPIENGRKKSE